MDSDLGLQMVAARNGASQATVQAAMVRRSAQSDDAVADIVAQAQTAQPTSRAPLPAGQGTKVDKLA